MFKSFGDIFAEKTSDILKNEELIKRAPDIHDIRDINREKRLRIGSNDNSFDFTIDDDSSSDEESIKQDLSSKLVSTLESLIFKGCFETTKSNSVLFKHYSRYCARKYQSIEMLVKPMSSFDLALEIKLLTICRENCTQLKCLRLSSCKMSVDMFLSLKNMFRSLECLHLEHIYGIETREEWTAVGKVFGDRLINIAVNANSKELDLSGMVSEVKNFNLVLEEYMSDMNQLFSNVHKYLYKLTLHNYYNVTRSAIKSLIEKCGPNLRQLELSYDSFHWRRANSTHIFVFICEKLPDLRVLRHRMITTSNMRPVFKMQKLEELDLQFSTANFLDFPCSHVLETLRYLSLTNVWLTPNRVEIMTKAFPLLLGLKLSGQTDIQFKDSPVFCCQCKEKVKTDDCLLCYQNCAMALIEFRILAILKFHFIRIKSSISTALPFLKSLKRVIINPYECCCGQSLLMSAIKIAKQRQFTFIIRKCFIETALEKEKQLPEGLHLIEYDQNLHN